MGHTTVSVRCACERWSAPNDLYWCESCSELRCGHPSCTTEVAEGGHCVSCGHIASYFDILKHGAICSFCSSCVCGATVRHAAASGTAHCTFCEIPLLIAAQDAVRDVSSDLATALRASDFARSTVLHQAHAAQPMAMPKKRSHPPSEDEETAQRILHAAQTRAVEGAAGLQPILGSEEHTFLPLDSAWASCSSRTEHTGGHLAQPLPLAPMLQRRCNVCASKDLPGVLLSPNPAPFALIGPQLVSGGAQGQLTWGTAKWFRKDCSMRHLLPSLYLFHVLPSGKVYPVPCASSSPLQPGLLLSGDGSFWACLSNPREVGCTVELHDAAGIAQALSSAAEPACSLAWHCASGQPLPLQTAGGTRLAVLQLQGKDEYGDTGNDGGRADQSTSMESASVRGEPSTALIQALESLLRGEGRSHRYDPSSSVWLRWSLRSAEAAKPVVAFAAMTACYTRENGEAGALLPIALRVWLD